MSQPPPYNRQTSFSNLQALNPSGQPPGNLMDAEYNAVKTTLDAILANLADIQNDDTTLGNETVGPAQLSSQLTAGFTAPTTWITGKSYTASPASTVLQGTALYICLVSHTSGTFATDLALGKWLLIFDLSTLTFGTASQISVSSHGSNISTNVQTSLNALDDNKAALSHTHTASQISDSTTAGRALLTAANLAAQQTLLGLGSLAFLNSVPATTAIPDQLAFTGVMNSGTLGASQNDFTPTGWSINSILRLVSNTSISITGFGATTDGDFKILQNVGINPITLVGNSALSAAANRIAIGQPVVIWPGQGRILQYDGAALQWRVLSALSADLPTRATKNLRMGNIATYLGDAAPSAPNTQVSIFAEELVLGSPVVGTWKVSNVAVTADGTVQNAANGTDGFYAIGTNAWYSVWVIGNNTTNAVAALLSTLATSPNLPSGYTHFARVGWMRTDGSSHFLKTLQYGRTARYVAASSLPNMASGSGTTTVSVTNFVPPTAAKIAVVLRASSATSGSISVAPNSSVTPFIQQAINANGGNDVIGELTLEGSSVYYVSSGGASTKLDAYGWEDNL